MRGIHQLIQKYDGNIIITVKPHNKTPLDKRTLQFSLGQYIIGQITEHSFKKSIKSIIEY